MVDDAKTPTSPTWPKLWLNLLVALVLGALVAAVVVFLREYFDDVVRMPEDVETKLGLPLLGLIPMVDESEDINAQLGSPSSSIAEAYHSLVTNLMYATPDGLPKTLLVTSSAEGQGKTTTSRMIATDLARLGHSVLLIDADLRRPTLHRRTEIANPDGLTAVLTGQKSLEEAMLSSGVDGLTYLTALPMPPDPALLLGGDRLGRLLQEARSRFEVVVIDSPPMLGLSDAALLASNVDGILMMADASQFHRGAMKATLRRLRLINAKLLGIVLTKFDPKSAAGDYNYYGYKYYSYEQRG